MDRGGREQPARPPQLPRPPQPQRPQRPSQPSQQQRAASPQQPRPPRPGAPGAHGRRDTSRGRAPGASGTPPPGWRPSRDPGDFLPPTGPLPLSELPDGGASLLQASSGGRSGNGPPPAPYDDHSDADDDATGPAQPNWKRWLAPTGLVIGLLLSATGAVMLDNPSSAQPVAATAQGAGVGEDTGATRTETPVLSARRAPELLTRPLVEQNLVNELGDWVDRSPEASCAVVSQGNAVMFDHNGDLAVPGASTQKIVTAVAALMTFGPDHRFETVAAGSDDVRDRVLAGDLYIVGGGDPLLTSEAYRNQLSRGTERLSDVADLADEIAATGVTHIQGSVIGDDSRYDDDRFHPAWPERFREQNQAGPISALNIPISVFPLPGGETTKTDPRRWAHRSQTALTVLSW